MNGAGEQRSANRLRNFRCKPCLTEDVMQERKKTSVRVIWTWILSAEMMVLLLLCCAVSIPRETKDKTVPATVGPVPSKTSPVTLIEFADFGCFECAQEAPNLRRLQREFGAKLIVIFKHFPSRLQQGTLLAHKAAVAAQNQGKFWEMHDLLFSHAGTLTAQHLDRMAGVLHLNIEVFHRDMASAANLSSIEKDIDEGKGLSITGTPTFFLDGRGLVGIQTYSDLRQMIESEIVKMQLHPEESKDK